MTGSAIARLRQRESGTISSDLTEEHPLCAAEEGYRLSLEFGLDVKVVGN